MCIYYIKTRQRKPQEKILTSFSDRKYIRPFTEVCDYKIKADAAETLLMLQGIECMLQNNLVLVAG